MKATEVKAAKVSADLAAEAQVSSALEEAAEEGLLCWLYESAYWGSAAPAAVMSEAEVEAARREAEAADALARRQALRAASEAAAALEVIKAMTAEVVSEAAAAVAQ